MSSFDPVIKSPASSSSEFMFGDIAYEPHWHRGGWKFKVISQQTDIPGLQHNQKYLLSELVFKTLKTTPPFKLPQPNQLKNQFAKLKTQTQAPPNEQHGCFLEKFIYKIAQLFTKLFAACPWSYDPEKAVENYQPRPDPVPPPSSTTPGSASAPGFMQNPMYPLPGTSTPPPAPPSAVAEPEAAPVSSSVAPTSQTPSPEWIYYSSLIDKVRERIAPLRYYQELAEDWDEKAPFPWISTRLENGTYLVFAVSQNQLEISFSTDPTAGKKQNYTKEGDTYENLVISCQLYDQKIFLTHETRSTQGAYFSQPVTDVATLRNGEFKKIIDDIASWQELPKDTETKTVLAQTCTAITLATTIAEGAKREAHDVQPFTHHVLDFIEAKRNILGLPTGTSKHCLLTPAEYAQLLKAINQSFFADKDDARAKARCTSVLRALDRDVHFITPGAKPSAPIPEGFKLSVQAFQKGYSTDVRDTLRAAAKLSDMAVFIQGASQGNYAESPDRYTPEVGGAMKTSMNDNSQGPFLRRADFIELETMNTFGANMGASMLAKVLPPEPQFTMSNPQRYWADNVFGAGYLSPNDADMPTVTQAIQDNFDKIEYAVCEAYGMDYGRQHLGIAPEPWGTPEQNEHPIYIVEQMAPAFGKYRQHQQAQTDTLEQEIACANYLALFREAIAYKKAHSISNVVVRATAVGGDLFGNKPENVVAGFELAAAETQQEMEQLGIVVKLDAFGGKGPLHLLAEKYALPGDYEKLPSPFDR